MHALSMYEWVWLINDNEWVHYGLKVQRCRENNGREERRGEERRGGGRFCRIKEASNRSISGICSFDLCMPLRSKHLGTKKLHRDKEREKNVGMFVLVIHNCSIKAWWPPKIIPPSKPCLLAITLPPIPQPPLLPTKGRS